MIRHMYKNHIILYSPLYTKRNIQRIKPPLTTNLKNEHFNFRQTFFFVSYKKVLNVQIDSYRF